MHKFIIFALTIGTYLALAGVGKIIAEGVFPDGLPKWVCYAGGIGCWLGIGFFAGVFKP